MFHGVWVTCRVFMVFQKRLLRPEKGPLGVLDGAGLQGPCPRGPCPWAWGVSSPAAQSPVELCTQHASRFWTTEPVFLFFM